MSITVPGLTHNAILDASPIPTSVTDAEGNIVYVNDAFLAYASTVRGKKVRREERVGGNVRDFTTGGYERDRQEWLALYDRVLKGGETILLEGLRGLQSSGRGDDRPEEMYVDLRMNPIKDPDGSVIAAVMVWRDVTARVIGQREERRRAALDQVRVAVYQMRALKDIRRVLVSLYRAMKDIGLEFEACSVEIVKEEAGIVEDYDLVPNLRSLRTEQFPLQGTAVYEAWRSQKPIYRRDLDEDDRYGEQAYIEEGIDKPIRSVVDIPFSHGTIGVNSTQPEAFSAMDIETLGHFAEVLSEAYTRFESMQRLEESERALRRRAALDRVRMSVYEMTEASDTQRVLISLSAALKDIGVDVRNCSVQLMDETKEMFACHHLGSTRAGPVSGVPSSNTAVYEAWRDQRPIYRRDLNEEDRYDEKSEIREGFGKRIRSVVDVPFSHGTIGVNSAQPDAFAEEDIETLRQFAEVLSEAYTRAEDIRRLEESEERYRSLVEHSQDVIFRLGLDRSYLLISQAIQELTGYAPEQFYSDTAFAPSIVLPEDLRKVEEALEKASAGEISRELEYRMRTKDGKILWACQNTFPVKSPEGSVVAIGGTLRDITERKRALEAEEQSEQQYRTTIDSIDDLIHVVGPDLRLILINRACTQWCEELGLPTDVIGQTVFEAFSFLPDRVRDEYRNVFESGETLITEEITNFEDGELTTEVRKIPVFEGERVVRVVTVVRDISETRRAAQALQEAEDKSRVQERLAAVGQLAAGIAHDFNNLLTGIIGYAQLLTMRADVSELAKKDLRRIEEQGQQAAHLIRQILDFSRKSIIQRQPLNLNTFIKEAIRFLDRTIPENVRISFDAEPDTYTIHADPAQIQDMLTNLSVNAKDAMQGGGTLSFHLAPVSLDLNQTPPCADMPPGLWIRLTVTDSGTGIPPEHLTRVFEPFFTTKEPGQGTGLGLAQVYGIVLQHEGFIKVDSPPGQGAVFSIYFPPIQENEQIPQQEEPENLSRGRGETILVVEDEPVVLEMISKMLEEMGYRTRTAGGGGQALDIYARHRDEIVLVLTDIVMPDMDGIEVFRALKQTYPEVVVVAMTGYPLEDEGEEFLAQGFTGWVQKPMDLDKLSRIMEEALR